MQQRFVAACLLAVLSSALGLEISVFPDVPTLVVANAVITVTATFDSFGSSLSVAVSGDATKCNFPAQGSPSPGHILVTFRVSCSETSTLGFTGSDGTGTTATRYVELNVANSTQLKLIAPTQVDTIYGTGYPFKIKLPAVPAGAVGIDYIFNADHCSFAGLPPRRGTVYLNGTEATFGKTLNVLCSVPGKAVDFVLFIVRPSGGYPAGQGDSVQFNTVVPSLVVSPSQGPVAMTTPGKASVKLWLSMSPVENVVVTLEANHIPNCTVSCPEAGDSGFLVFTPSLFTQEASLVFSCGAVPDTLPSNLGTVALTPVGSGFAGTVQTTFLRTPKGTSAGKEPRSPSGTGPQSPSSAPSGTAIAALIFSLLACLLSGFLVFQTMRSRQSLAMQASTVPLL